MKTVISFFIRYPIWANVIIIMVALLGIVSYLGIKKGFFPELTPRNITIQVSFPGASPEEMEEGVTAKIEEALKGIEGIEEITSVSAENIATVNVKSKKGYDVNEVLTDVKNAVDRISSFPDDAEKPVVFVAKEKGRAITIVLLGDVPLQRLKAAAERIEDDFLSTGFISQITLHGFPDVEISVDVKEETLLRYNLTFDEIVRAIRQNNRDISGGLIRSATEEMLIRSNAKEYEAGEIEKIILRTNADGSIVRVGDVAAVRERFSEDPSKSTYNKKNAVTITVEKLPEEDIMEITRHVRNYVAAFNSANRVMQLTVQQDESDLLRQRLQLLLKNGAMGLALVLITLGIFLNLRVSFWVAASIPFSFLGMFIIGNLLGITINMISLFGMILVVGILVDDGIVVSENIYAHYEKGKSRIQAAIDGTAEVIWPVFASVTTTIVAFCMIFFLEGRIGEFMSEMSIVVISCLAVSLMEAFVILPTHLAYSKGLAKAGEQGKARQALEHGLDFLRMKIYAPLLRQCIAHKWITMASTAAIMMIIIGLVRGELIKFTFFPPIERDDLQVSLVLAPGTREVITEKILRDIEDKVWQVNRELSKDRADSLDVILSTKVDMGSAGTETGSHTGSISIKLLDTETRNMSSFAIAAAVRNRVGGIPEADKFTVGTRQVFGKPVSVSLTSKNLDDLHQVKERLKKKLSGFSALRDITDTDVPGRREIHIKPKPEAYLLGLTQGEIARQIRQGFFGEEIQRLQKGSDEVRVWARYAESDRQSIGKLEAMKIKTPSGQEYPLAQLADYQIQRATIAISRINGAREIRVEADLENQNEPVLPILEHIDKVVMPQILSAFPGVRYAFKGQQEEGTKFASSMQKTVPVILSFMFIIVVLVFRSFSQAAMIFTMIPIGVFCAILGHGIETLLHPVVGRPVSILSSYGMLALTGVIINDSIVFLNKFNSLMKEGMSAQDAAYNAGLARFRPILLTSITTVAGLYPLILNKSMQAQFLIPMAISIAYGVLIGTFFTLTYFPAFILLVNDIRRVVRWLISGKIPSREDVEPAVLEKKRLAGV